MARTIAKDYDAKRTAILQKAATHFADHGYDRSSVNQVAKACGISKALIYHYYDSKEQLLYDILHSHLSVVRRRVAGVAQGASTHEAHLRNLVGELLIAYRGADAEHRLQLQTPNALSPEQLQELTNIQRQIVKLFAATLEHLAPAYFAKDPHHQIPVTMSLLGMLNWFYLWYQPGRGINRDEYAEMATQILLGGLDRMQR